MAAISKITIDGFKAFPNSFTLDLEDGKNLLMYGENGSGKSSIYYALHSLLQSQCKDKNSTYFDPNNAESLVNQQTKKPDAKVTVLFTGSDVSYSISHAGYHESVTQPISPLRDLNGQCVFINHKFLFNGFCFRYSLYIVLFSVFIIDILPFTLTQDKSDYISNIYDDVMKGIKRRGKSNTIDPSYQAKIDKFNVETKYVIDQINSNAIETATTIYNNHFRNSEDHQLRISLCYDNNKDKVPQPNKSYWLRCGLRYQNVEKAGVMEPKSVSTSMELLQPAITLKVEELLGDGVTYRHIEKPQTYFNEAKLTAIALSIRFALLDTVTAANGRFLALDDMLISLDMSNRTKVINYLLDVISEKYKVYLFTHDRAFFEHCKEKIIYANKAKGLSRQNGWLFKELYNDDIPQNNPKELASESDVSRAKAHYDAFDYPASANYLRKAVETLVRETFPPKLTRQDNGLEHDKLRNVLEASFALFQKIPGINLSDLSHLIGNLNLLLNPLSHKSTETNVYKTELKEIFGILERLREQIVNLDIQEVLPRTDKIYLLFKEDEHITQKYEIELQEELYSYQNGITRAFCQAKAKSLNSCTITDGVEGDYVKNEHYKGTIEKICIDVHNRKGSVYANDYWDLYQDKDGNCFNTLI